jgi:hypothetical protein
MIGFAIHQLYMVEFHRKFKGGLFEAPIVNRLLKEAK